MRALHQQTSMGDHTIFVGEVLTAHVNEGVFNCRFDPERVKLIYHAGGDGFASLAPEIVSPGIEKEEK